jgi:chromosome segregation ATPase
MADYLNEVMAPAFTRYEENSAAIANLSVTMADLIDTVTMLSDSLIEMTARQTEFQTVFQGQLEKLQTSQAEYAQNLAAETRTRWEQTQMQFEQIQAQMAQVQGDLKQHAGTLQQLHADLMSVAASQTSQQKAIEELQTVVEETRRAHRLTADAQQEFLIQEQRVIVETQKVVLGDLQAQIDDLLAQQKLKNEELATAVQNLRTMVETKSKAAGRRPSPIETA